MEGYPRQRDKFQDFCNTTLEGRCLLAGFANPLTISEFPVPTQMAGPLGIVTGPDGNLWFTEQYANAVGSINPSTHVINEYPVPTASAGVEGIALGPDGNLWFTESAAGAIGVINPTTDAISEYPIPNASSSPASITLGPDGNLWFTDPGSGMVGSINPTTHAITEFPLPTADASPDGITLGPDGNLWFTESAAGNIASINPQTDVVTEYPLPSSTSGPAGIVAGPDGNLWFVESEAGNVGSINPSTGAIAEYPLASNSSDPQSITLGADGNLWFTEDGTYGTLSPTDPGFGMINPNTLAVWENPLSSFAVDPAGIVGGPDGNLWFADSGGSIGVVTDPLPVVATHLAVSTEPPASVVAGTSFGLTITAEDDLGRAVTSFNGPVTISLVGSPAGVNLGGPVTVNAVNGVATFSGLTLAPKGNQVTLQGTGDGLTSSATTSVTVTGNLVPTQVGLTSSLAHPLFGEAETFTATVTPNSPDTVSGTVTFLDGSTPLGTASVSFINGVYSATFTTSTLAIGSHSVTASYGGDNNNFWSTSTASAISVSPPSTGDYNGDGTTDPAVFRSSTDQWIIHLSGAGVIVDQFGDPSQHDEAVPGDYEGDGHTDLAVFRPSTDQWIIRLASGAVRIIQFGDPTQGDVPVPGDYEGNGTTDLAVFRPSTDQWIIRLASGAVRIVQFGDPTQGDVPVPGDYDGSGRTDLAVFRPGTDQWIVSLSNGVQITQFGDPTQGDLPAPGNYFDGAGRAEIAIYRPSTAEWLVDDPIHGLRVFQFGDPANSDIAAESVVDALLIDAIPTSIHHTAAGPSSTSRVASAYFTLIALPSRQTRPVNDLWLAALDELSAGLV